MTLCKTCDEKVSGTQRFWCFSCGVVLHMTPEFTGFSASVVKSFQEVTRNVLLLCNLCAENERQTLIQDVYASRMNRLEEENNQKLQAMQDKLDEYKINVSGTYASVVALKKETKNIALKLEQLVQVKAFESKFAEPRSLRLQGCWYVWHSSWQSVQERHAESRICFRISRPKEVQCQKPKKSWPIQRPQTQTTNSDSTGR